MTDAGDTPSAAPRVWLGRPLYRWAALLVRTGDGVVVASGHEVALATRVEIRIARDGVLEPPRLAVVAATQSGDGAFILSIRFYRMGDR